VQDAVRAVAAADKRGKHARRAADRRDVAVHQARQRVVDQPGRLAAAGGDARRRQQQPVAGRHGTVITRTDRFAGVQRFGMTRDYREPSWFTNRLLLVFNCRLADTVAIDQAGNGDADVAGWFSDPQSVQLGKGQAAAHADVLALLAGSNHTGRLAGNDPPVRDRPTTDPPVPPARRPELSSSPG
jgi:hypothetical protein